AVVTEPFRKPAAPPAGLPDLPRLVLLQLCRLFRYLVNEVIHEEYQPLESRSVIAALASSSHLSFSGCPECPLTHFHSTECIFERESRRSQRSRFRTGSFLLLIQPRLIQPDSHSFIPFARYWESVVRTALDGRFSDSRAAIAAVSSILLLVVSCSAPESSFS